MLITFHENVGHSRAWAFVPDCLAELLREGLSQPQYEGPVWNDAALIATNEFHEYMGHIVYRPSEVRASWWIMQSYTRPTARRQGVHAALFKALVQRAKEKGDVLCIDSGTHADNLVAQHAFQKQGRRVVGIFYEYRLKEVLPGKAPHKDGKQA
jgi:GNAT superfamily N-acetyltransferase